MKTKITLSQYVEQFTDFVIDVPDDFDLESHKEALIKKHLREVGWEDTEEEEPINVSKKGATEDDDFLALYTWDETKKEFL